MKYQVCRPLTPIEFEALKADVAENGVLVPVEVDENGDILDGHHRVQAWQELRAEGVELPQWAKLIRSGLTEEQKRNHARKLNALRRQMSDDERKQMMVDMRQDGMSYRKIAEAVGVDPMTVHSVVKKSGVEISTPVNGADGKNYPAQQQPKPAPPPTLFVPGESVSLDPKAAKQSVKKAKEDRRAANQQTYQQNGHAPFEPPSHPSIHIHNLDARQLAAYATAVDLVITSPPYNVGIDYDTYVDDAPNYFALLDTVFDQCHAVMVEGARIAVVVPFGIGRNPYTAFDCQIMSTLLAVGFQLRGRIIWDKGTTGNRTSWGSFRMSTNPSLRDTCECIIVAQKGDANLAMPETIKQTDATGSYTPWLQDGDYFMELAQDHWIVAPESAKRIGHPAPFPPELVRRLLHFYGYPGCHVLDPFAGSGTVGVVAGELGCEASLFEISQAYCEIAKERLHGQVS